MASAAQEGPSRIVIFSNRYAAFRRECEEHSRMQKTGESQRMSDALERLTARALAKASETMIDFEKMAQEFPLCHNRCGCSGDCQVAALLRRVAVAESAACEAIARKWLVIEDIIEDKSGERGYTKHIADEIAERRKG